MDLNNLWLGISKLATMLVDRRLWIALLFIGGTVLGANEWVNNADPLADDIVEAIRAIWVGVSALVSVVMLLYSYTKRAPSGLKDPNEELVDRVAEKLAEKMAEKVD